MSTNYNIKRDDKGIEQVFIKFTWFDQNGGYNEINSHDLDSAADILGLLRGEICLGDLEP
jgi:hypothetical protein